MTKNNRSPAKKNRNYRRLVKFLQAKIPPMKTPKILSFSQPTIISISTPPRPLSLSKPVLTSIPPVFSQPSLSSTIAVPKHVPVYERPASILDSRIPQLDGLAWNHDHQPQPSMDCLQCSSCQKTLETEDDWKWHYETEIGQQNCSILRSMLPY